MLLHLIGPFALAVILFVAWLGSPPLEREAVPMSPTAIGAQSQDEVICRYKGQDYFKEIGSWPRLSDGRDAEQVVRERCARSVQAFGRHVRF